MTRERIEVVMIRVVMGLNNLGGVPGKVKVIMHKLAKIIIITRYTHAQESLAQQ